MTNVSFTVKDQSVREHMISVHGHSRQWYVAHTEEFITAEHTKAHDLKRNQLIEHTHEEQPAEMPFMPFVSSPLLLTDPPGRLAGHMLECHGPRPTIGTIAMAESDPETLLLRHNVAHEKPCDHTHG